MSIKGEKKSIKFLCIIAQNSYRDDIQLDRHSETSLNCLYESNQNTLCSTYIYEYTVSNK